MESKRHTDRAYDAELKQLRDKLLLMAGTVEQMISEATQALTDGDTDRAKRTIAADRKVNDLEIETDELCLVILAKRHPLASDLRMITLAMKMVTDLERIGDLAVNICERVLALGGAPRPAVADASARMSDAVQEMIRTAIEAFIAGDVALARSVFEKDEIVDQLYRDITRGVQRTMREERDYLESGVHLAAVAKFLERMGDHATNLAEHVIFLVDGKDIRHSADRR